MKRPKIIFVEPKAPGDNVFSKYLALPLMGPVYLATMLKQKGYDVKVLNENMLGRNVEISDLDCDILCLTGLSSTIQRAYGIAKHYKHTYPNGKVLLGGIHASMMPDEAKNYADYLFIGEAESSFLQVIKQITTGTKEKMFRGDHICIDDVPTPDFGLVANSHKMPLTPVITSRGCPFDCKFCSVTEMFGKKYRMRSIPKVIDDLKAVKSKKVFFYDDNLTAMKKRSHEMLRAMGKAGINKRWTAQVRCDVTNDPKLVEKMADAGCYTVYVGFESINPKTLAEFKKSQTPDMIKKAIRIFHDNDIKIHGMFMFGADADDKKVFKRTQNFCHDHDVDFAQFAVLTPLPGTGTFREMERDNRLLHRNWKYYEGLHAVFRPKNMTAYELQQGMLDSFYDFYSYSRAVNDSLNAVADISTAAIRAWYSKVQLPDFSAIAIRAGAKSIVKSWERQNQEYLDFLAKIDLKRRFATSRPTP